MLRKKKLLRRLVFLTALLVLNVVFLFIFFRSDTGTASSSANTDLRTQLPKEFPEMKELAAKKDLDFQSLSNYFTDLANKKGAVYAFEVLKRAELPLNIDLHLLGHVVGDILYVQQGVDGMRYCTHDFRNACSHSIVVAMFLKDGEKAIKEIAPKCHEAPGGSGAYTMCFHGLGHGILAYYDYKMEPAITSCKKTGTPAYNNREYIECSGGVVMEMMSGINNREAWQKEAKNYFKEDDPLAPCSSDFMPPDVKPICYNYLTPHLLEFVGGDLGNPTEQNFADSFPLCDRIPIDQKQNRDACYGGFGKEFIGFANGRDIRKTDKMTDEQYRKVYDWCILAKQDDGIKACINYAMSSVYWGGENDRSASIRYCGVMGEYESSCIGNLIQSVSTFVKDKAYRASLCSELPQAYQQQCQSSLL